jgi:hypothetical protein
MEDQNMIQNSVNSVSKKSHRYEIEKKRKKKQLFFMTK